MIVFHHRASWASSARTALFAAIAVLAMGWTEKAAAEPSLEETIAFTRAELTRLCDDPRKSGVDALDRLKIGGHRNCQIVLTPGRLNFSVRERGSEYSGSGFAQLKMELRFTERSGFLCGRPANDGRAPLFFTCDASKGAKGRTCAERDLSVDRPDNDPFETHQKLAAAAILRTAPTECGMLARALTFIGERTKAAPDEDVRDFFAAK